MALSTPTPKADHSGKPQYSLRNLEALARFFPFQGYIERTEHRAISLRQLLDVVRYCSEEVHNWTDTSPKEYSKTSGQTLSMDILNLHHLNAWVIMPGCYEKESAWVEQASGKVQKPKWFVSHWWGDLVQDFVWCIQEHCKVRRLPDDTCFWVCAYANRQHRLREELFRNPKECSFFKALVEADGLLLVLDPTAMPFTRAWCAFEMAMAFTEPEAKISAVDMSVCKDGVVSILTDGVPQDDKYFKTLFRDGAFGKVGDEIPCNMQRVALQQKFQREADFPISILDTAVSVDLAKCEASDEDDRKHILNCMAGIPELDAEPPLEHPKYTEANRKLSGIVLLAAWPQLLAKGLVKDWNLSERLKECKDMKEVSLCFNYIEQCDDEAVASLAAGLPEKLKDLDLEFVGCEKVTDASPKTLAAVMPQQLETLLLHFNDTKVTDEGAVAVAKSVPPTVSHFDIRFHNCKGVTDVSAVALANSLNSNMHTIVLNFAGCAEMGDDGALAVAEHLPSTVQKLTMYFGGTKLTDVGLAALAMALPPALREFTFFYPNSGSTDVGTRVLVEELKARRMLSSIRVVHVWPPVNPDNFSKLEQLDAWGGPSAPLEPFWEFVSKVQRCDASKAARRKALSVLAIFVKADKDGSGVIARAKFAELLSRLHADSAPAWDKTLSRVFPEATVKYADVIAWVFSAF